jgi:hypothetical protein
MASRGGREKGSRAMRPGPARFATSLQGCRSPDAGQRLLQNRSRLCRSEIMEAQKQSPKSLQPRRSLERTPASIQS